MVGGDFSLKIRTEDNMKFAKENSGYYPTGSPPRCPLLLLVPPEGTYLSEYKGCSLHSSEAINTTGNAGYWRTKHIFRQAPTQKECFIICSNKYVQSNVKHQKHLFELLEIMKLLFRGLYIMEFPSRPHKGTSMPLPTRKVDSIVLLNMMLMWAEAPA